MASLWDSWRIICAWATALVGALHGLAGRFEPVIERLVRDYRRAPVKHADETGWRTDGRNGYAWLFCTETISLFRFRGSRSAQIALQVLGPRRLAGVLVVDRYHGYNRAIPADNNRAERELRPLVIARKISFGSQSEAGARTREVLMSVLHTLRKHTDDVTAAFQRVLDRFGAGRTRRSLQTAVALRFLLSPRKTGNN